MVKAFVVGKFLPFHKGHEAMIHFALTKCDLLTVLICCSDKENISDTTRKKWIEKSFEGYKNIEVKSFNYLENELPNSSESSTEVSKIWSVVFKKMFPDYTLFVSSEKYGDFVAGYMNIRHIFFDESRALFPVSASAIRSDLFANWKFLPGSVKPDFVIKVVLLGTESTGKSTLTQQLAQHYNCSLVSEAGRDIIDDSNEFSFNDLHLVATEHAKRIDEAVLGESPLIIIDTDIHITKSYAQFIFEKELDVDDDIIKSNQANLYLYLGDDAPYMQDGTRLNQIERNFLDLSHREILQRHKIDTIEIWGNWTNRFDRAVKEIDSLLLKRAVP